MDKKIFRIAVSVLCVLLVVGGFYGIKKLTGAKKTPSSTSYIVETATKSNINVSIAATGTVYAAVTKDVAANNSGEIRNLNVKAGNRVKKGDVLFQAYSQQLYQQLQSAKIDLQKQNIQLNNLKNQAAQTTQTNGQSGQQQVNTQSSQNQIDLQKLQVESSQNSLANIQQQYDNMTVKSPIDGVVTAVDNANGDTAQSGKAVLTVTDPTSLKIQTSVDELDISKVQTGQKAAVTLNAITGKTFDGTVEAISSIGSTSNNVTTYDVTIGLSDTTGIMLGMTANVNILVASKTDAIVVPTEAIIDRGSRKFVMVQGTGSQQSGTSTASGNSWSNGSTNSNGSQGGTRRMGGNFQGISNAPGRLVEVQTGLANETYVEITSGITEGQKIMVALPQGSSTTTTNSRNSMRALGGFGGGGFGGGASGGGSYRRSFSGN